MKEIQRYQIAGDNSGHDYFIPVGQEALFYQWVDATENYEESELDFNDCRIEGRFTFTDPKVE